MNLYENIKANLNEAQNIDWILNRWNDLDMADKQNLGGDAFYHTLLTSVDDAEKFNYHSDYWGNANDYQDTAVELMYDIEPLIGEVVEYSTDDGETYKIKVNGVYVDNQYNSHLKLAVDWLDDMKESDKGIKYYIYHNAESEDKSDAESMLDNYSKEYPELTFRLSKDNNGMYYVDFIGTYQAISNALINLGYYNEEEINNMMNENLIKPLSESQNLNEAEDTKLTDAKKLEIIKDKVDELVSQGKMIQEDNEYFYIGLPEYFKDNGDSNILKALRKHFMTDFSKPLKANGIDISITPYDKGYKDDSFYSVNAPVEIRDGTPLKADNIFEEKTNLLYSDAFPEVIFPKSINEATEELSESIEQKYNKSNPDYNRFLRDVKQYTGSYDYLFGGKVNSEVKGYPIQVNYFYYNRPYVGGGYNLVTNVLTPMGSSGEYIQDAIDNEFERNSKNQLSNNEIKEKILQVLNNLNKED